MDVLWIFFLNYFYYFVGFHCLLGRVEGKRRTSEHRRVGFVQDPPGLLPGAHLSPVYVSYNSFVHTFIKARGLFAPNAPIPSAATYVSMMNAVIQSKHFKDREALANFVAHALFFSSGFTRKELARPVEGSVDRLVEEPVSVERPTDRSASVERPVSTEGQVSASASASHSTSASHSHSHSTSLSTSALHSYHPRGYCPVEGEAAYRDASLKIFGDDRLVLVPELVSADEDVNWRVSILSWEALKHQQQPAREGSASTTTAAATIENIFQTLRAFYLLK